MVHNHPKRTPTQDYKVSMKRNPRETNQENPHHVSEADRVRQASRQRSSKDESDPTVLMMSTLTDTGKGMTRHQGSQEQSGMSSSSQVSSHPGCALLTICNEQKPRTGDKHQAGRIGDLGRACAVDKTEG